MKIGDSDVATTSSEAAFAISNATEMFIGEKYATFLVSNHVTFWSYRVENTRHLIALLRNLPPTDKVRLGYYLLHSTLLPQLYRSGASNSNWSEGHIRILEEKFSKDFWMKKATTGHN